LAPAVNIQRNPIGGRNFKYHSEDPRHTGFCGLSITLGTQENNEVSTCPKHFAINEQETYRSGSIKNTTMLLILLLRNEQVSGTMNKL
jgi:beta-glucosidase